MCWSFFRVASSIHSRTAIQFNLFVHGTCPFLVAVRRVVIILLLCCATSVSLCFPSFHWLALSLLCDVPFLVTIVAILSAFFPTAFRWLQFICRILALCVYISFVVGVFLCDGSICWPNKCCCHWNGCVFISCLQPFLSLSLSLPPPTLSLCACKYVICIE